MIDFGALPPEVNSGRMWGAIGSASLAASGAAWQALAVQLGSASAAINAIITELSASYMGPSSVALVEAATPFVAWLGAHAMGAEQSALLAIQSAEAFETARLAHIPLPVVEENRAELATLVATNFMGVNTPAIAANEALYSEYWAQDAAAMYGYAADGSAVASGWQATPFIPPAPTTDPAGLAGQAAAVGQSAGQSATQAAATATSAGDQAGSMGSGLSSLGGMASSAVQPIMSIPQQLSSLASPLGSLSSMFGGMSGAQGLTGGGILGGLSGFSSVGSMGGGASPVSASMGRGMWLPSVAGASDGSPTGRLSVPASWAGAVPRESVMKTTGVAATVTEEGAPAMGAAPRAAMMPAAMGGNTGNTTLDNSNKKYLAKPRVVSHWPYADK